MRDTLIICVPKVLMPDYPARAAKANGDTPDLYVTIPCPDCSMEMWLGPRSKSLVESGTKVACAVCAILKHGVREDSKVTALTDTQQT